MSVLSRHRISTMTRGALGACVLSLALGATAACATESARPNAGPWQLAQTGAAPPAARKPAPAANVREVAGRYAVLRAEGKDTGCMVTLSADQRGRGYRAQLAPACRDQGIVIFDPVSWTLERGHISLTARKGHKTVLELQPDGTWFKKDAKPLGLKKI